MNQGGPFFNSGASRKRWSAQNLLCQSNFNQLFTVKNLKLATIASSRTGHSNHL